MLFSYDIVLIVYFLCYAVVNVQETNCLPRGGLKWTRTTAINGLGAVGLYPEAFASWWAKVDSNHRQNGLGAVGLYPEALASWWAKVDSNHRPHAYQACALTS